MDTPDTRPWSTKKAEPDALLAALREACQDEAKAIVLFELMRWPDGQAVCPRCGVVGRSYAMMKRGTQERERHHRWRCRDCKEMFSVRTASVWEETRLPMRVWARAMWAAAASKKGVSAKQIERECEVSYKTALYLMHRIRYAMEVPETAAPLHGVLEADETYVGGNPRPFAGRGKRHGTGKGSAPRVKRGRGTLKTPVLALVQRGGEVRFQDVHGRLTSKTLGDFIYKHADLRSTLCTDEYLGYKPVGRRFKGGHKTVVHSQGEYARPDGAHSNTAESVFSRLKRGVYGVWHSVSKHHLHRYLSNIAFLHNTRKMTDSERLQAAVRGGLGRRLIYREASAGA